MKNYKFDPTEYGYENISKFPELDYMHNTINERTFLKIIEYSDLKGLVYWYSIIYIPSEGEDRIRIQSGSHDTRKPATYEEQTGIPITKYFGLISSDSFAKALLPHILGTTQNISVNTYGVERLNSNRNEEMREHFKTLTN